MEPITIKAFRRDVVGKKVKILRQEGKLPAVLYGKGMEPLSIMMDLKEATRILKTASSSSLVTIDLDGNTHTTLVRDRQRDFIKGTLMHVDFLAVSLTEKVTALVNIVLEGEAPALETYDGLLVAGLDQVEVESLPQDLPERITVDVSILEEIGEAIYVRDLVVPPNVEILEDPDELVVVVASTAVAEEEEEELEEALEGGAEPEVIERGKAEEGESED